MRDRKGEGKLVEKRLWERWKEKHRQWPDKSLKSLSDLKFWYLCSETTALLIYSKIIIQCSKCLQAQHSKPSYRFSEDNYLDIYYFKNILI